MNIVFLNNKYTKWYYSLISKRKISIPLGYSEKHHIEPRSLGGSNHKDNLELELMVHYQRKEGL
jgi:hypothetical protein